jgi:Co/Zn/Cd efflux system component
MNETTVTEEIPLLQQKKTENDFNSPLKQLKSYFQMITSDNKTRILMIFSTFMLVSGILQIIIFGTIYSHSLIIIYGGLHLVQISFSHYISAIHLFLSTRQVFLHQFSYGFDRFEILFRFSNIIFLWFISLAMVVESFHHLIDPHPLYFDHLWILAFFNFVLISSGIYYFKLKSNLDFNLLNNISKNAQNQKLLMDAFRDCLTQFSIILCIILSKL